MTAIDPSTVEIKIAQPQGDFLFNIGRGDAVIVAPESAGKKTNLTQLAPAHSSLCVGTKAVA